MAAVLPQVKTEGKLYKRFAEIGRIVLIQYGPDAGKLATIIDILDHNRALIDGPTSITGVRRQVINFKWVALTDLKLGSYYNAEKGKVTRSNLLNAREKTLAAHWVKADILAKWNASSWAKRRAARDAKAASTDFDRFKTKLAKQKVAKALRAKLSA